MKSRNKNYFFAKAIIFTIIGIFLFSVINGIYMKTLGYRELNGIDKFRNVPENIEIANFGTSHGLRGFEYPNNLTAFNFALDAQHPKYDYELLRQFEHNFKEGAVIIIPVSYISIGLDLEYENLKKATPRYYSIMNKPWRIDGFKIGDWIKYGIFPILSAGDNLEYLFEDKDEPFKDWLESPRNEIPDIDKMCKERALHHQKIISKDSEAENIRYIEDMIIYAKEKGFKPVLVTTPYMKKYKESYSKDFLKRFYKNIEKIQSDTNIEYIDYSSLKGFEADVRLYRDSDHLNEKGRKEFTKIMLEELKNRGYIKTLSR